MSYAYGDWRLGLRRVYESLGSYIDAMEIVPLDEAWEIYWGPNGWDQGTLIL